MREICREKIYTRRGETYVRGETSLFEEKVARDVARFWPSEIKKMLANLLMHHLHGFQLKVIYIVRYEDVKTTFIVRQCID